MVLVLTFIKMPFKFNFNEDNKVSADENDHNIIPETEPIATLIQIEDQCFKSIPETKISEILVGQKVLKHVSSQAAEEQLKQTCNPVSEAITSFSDLIPNVYEGGLKIWECSVDLANYLSSSGMELKDVQVLELGCGAGLPSLFAYVSGASCCFQDFNKEVISLLTIPNVILNTDKATQDHHKRTSFIAGDWSKVPQVLQNFPKFDVILTSETIYNVASQKKLLEVMKSALKSDGSIFLAAKTCYFGVGGSMRQFEDLLTTDGTFKFCTVWKTDEGVQREILHLTFKQVQK